jgi:hypothetical protein
VNGEKARGLIPPRPNLGPEPWREPDPTPGLLLALCLSALAGLLAIWLWRRRRTLGTRGTGASTNGPPAAEPTPRDRLVGLSETIRDALTAQFGPSCRAKTTEEISADERLTQLVGEESFRDLILFLDRIDLLKFAPDRSENHDEELGGILRTWEPRMTALAARIRVKPRARLRPGAAHTKATALGLPAENGSTRTDPR